MSETAMVEVQNNTRYAVVIGDGLSVPCIAGRKGGRVQVPAKVWESFSARPHVKGMLAARTLVVVDAAVDAAHRAPFDLVTEED
jgi:hypothetical protein